MDTDTEMHETLVTLTADIVAAHVSNNSVAVSDLPLIIQNVHGALSALGKPTEEPPVKQEPRSEEHTSELQSLMRISYAVFCLKKKRKKIPTYYILRQNTFKHY